MAITEFDMKRPTDKQMEAIRNIERNLPYIKFVGKSKQDAFRFINEHMELSKAAYRKHRSCVSRPSRIYRQETTNHRPKKSPQERYEDYIENVSLNYVGCGGDDWGGFESRAIARKLHSFEDWQMAGEP